jgi:hypothetical protein
LHSGLGFDTTSQVDGQTKLPHKSSAPYFETLTHNFKETSMVIESTAISAKGGETGSWRDGVYQIYKREMH